MNTPTYILLLYFLSLVLSQWLLPKAMKHVRVLEQWQKDLLMKAGPWVPVMNSILIFGAVRELWWAWRARVADRKLNRILRSYNLPTLDEWFKMTQEEQADFLEKRNPKP